MYVDGNAHCLAITICITNMVHVLLKGTEYY